MPKILIIDRCNNCHFYKDYHCYHPRIAKPHPEGVKPKKIKPGVFDEPFINIKIPSWCPLTDTDETESLIENMKLIKDMHCRMGIITQESIYKLNI